jgi:hypothetical protein
MPKSGNIFKQSQSLREKKEPKTEEKLKYFSFLHKPDKNF